MWITLVQIEQQEGRGEEAQVRGVHPRVQVSRSKVKNSLL